MRPLLDTGHGFIILYWSKGRQPGAGAASLQAGPADNPVENPAVIA
jgi:hypothetical protein